MESGGLVGRIQIPFRLASDNHNEKVKNKLRVLPTKLGQLKSGLNEKRLSQSHLWVFSDLIR